MTSGQAQGQFDQRVFSQEWEYDFALDGGAVGPINMRSVAPSIPSGAVITGAMIDVLTSFAGPAGTTLAMGIESASDLQAAGDPNTFTVGRNVAVAGAAGGLTGIIDGQLLLSATVMTAGAIKTTANRIPKLTPAVHALTAGKCVLVIMFVMG